MGLASWKTSWGGWFLDVSGVNVFLFEVSLVSLGGVWFFPHTHTLNNPPPSSSLPTPSKTGTDPLNPWVGCPGQLHGAAPASNRSPNPCCFEGHRGKTEDMETGRQVGIGGENPKKPKGRHGEDPHARWNLED